MNTRLVELARDTARRRDDEPVDTDIVLSTESKTVAELVDQLTASIHHTFAAESGSRQGEAR